MPSGKFFCLEDALGGPDGVFQEAYKTALTYAEHPTRRCSVCGKKHLSQADIDFTIRRNYGLDHALVLKIKQKLLQSGVEIDKIHSENGEPKCHNFCSIHYPKPIRIFKEHNSSEFAEFECPVCKVKWVLYAQDIHK